ncbi:helix-turn-helix domain-containing protein [Pseudonocardia sp. ICBG1034]|uniref:helix-turn-helix domain-containing protein n=1 Tax=Pseudonocardia sp. ICBG1034 TaxID=2844381 RepID=UPI001CCCE11D|nr:helix-turn-helix domain-containing protein [Pseudonocardia sp. ICBG1034]
MPSSGPVDASVERADSLTNWADLIRDRFVPLQITTHGPSDLRGAVRTRHIGHLQVARVRSVPQTFRRTRALVTASESDVFAVGVIRSGTGYLEQDGRRCVVADGGFALYDTTRPFTWSLDGSWDMRVYTWPRNGVPFTDLELEALTARTVSPASAVGTLLAPMLDRLADDRSPSTPLAPTTAVRLADEVMELAVLAATDHHQAAGHLPVDPQHDLLVQVQEFVQDNLTRPGLDAGCIAQELYISTRTLHRLFARHDLTVAGWIKARRLDACRRALSGPGGGDLPIHRIAAQHGFTNASFFSREFTARFGLTPRECRLRSRR